jgi:hypothetical protein
VNDIRKYEFTGALNAEGLRRIIALNDFAMVKKGDVGGWIADEKNL